MGIRLVEKNRRLRDLRQGEDGSIVVFGLYLALIILGIAGFAVDLMRVEAERSAVQGALDTAVLAATDIDQKGDPATVVKDYMAAAGLASALDGDPVVSTTGPRTVTANTKITTNPLFKMFRAPLQVANTSTAENAAPKVEISLVLDISGSMAEQGRDEYGRPIATTRIEALRSAVDDFVKAVLGSTSSGASVSIVPFSEQVGIPESIFNTLRTDPYQPQRSHTNSFCVDLPNSEYDRVALDTTVAMRQTQHIQIWKSASEQNPYLGGDPSLELTSALCPYLDGEVVIPISNNLATLQTAIAALRPSHGTQINNGVKWGAVMLDPSIRETVRGELVTAMKGRPVDYGGETRKFLIVVSDGENSDSYRAKDKFYDQDYVISRRVPVSQTWSWNCWCYVTSYETQELYRLNREYWANYNFNYYEYNVWPRYTDPYYPESMRTRYMSYTQANNQLSRICAAARAKGIEILGIGVHMPRAGVAPMMDCVGNDSNNYFDVADDQIQEAFRKILSDAIKLRLTL
ncbi:MAG: hypothetical protein CSA72_01955 [Rhodobacterales bacterium]|nr:MAG: hypothetical protein CSA72_01955 [Rhodobacterales bacterium]